MIVFLHFPVQFTVIGKAKSSMGTYWCLLSRNDKKLFFATKRLLARCEDTWHASMPKYGHQLKPNVHKKLLNIIAQHMSFVFATI
jgi:hypothetical protein